MYHSRIVLSVGGSVWYMIRNLRCTVTIDSVLANSKTQNAFLFTVNAIFLHDYPLAVEPGRTPTPLVQKKKLREILYLLIWSFLPCLSWLLRSRVRKSRRDLRITLYFYWNFTLILRVFCTFLLKPSYMLHIFVQLRTKIISDIYYTVLPVGSNNSHAVCNMAAESLCLLFCRSLLSHFQQIPHKNIRCLYLSYIGLYN